MAIQCHKQQFMQLDALEKFILSVCVLEDLCHKKVKNCKSRDGRIKNSTQTTLVGIANNRQDVS